MEKIDNEMEMKEMATMEKEMETMEMEHRIHRVREDLAGDPLAAARLVKAAVDENWAEAEKLLAAGADPRICRWGDAYGVESALYMALSDKQFALAEKLYDAGDRLDDLVTETERPLPWEVLDFLASEMRCGRNYFHDRSKPLSECCRCSAFEQIEKLLPEAGQEELNKSIAPTVRAWIRHSGRPDVYPAILEDLLARGARLAEAEKAELLADIEARFGRCPAVMHPGKEKVERMVRLIEKA